ncbi:MAG: glycoside hydrolase family 3 N-terminal domain-containing protein [Bacteroidia bacterium]
MFRLFFLLIVSLSVGTLVAQPGGGFVRDLLAQMTLHEKVGQMTQLTIDAISVGAPYNLPEPHTLDAQKLERVIVEYGVGSILNVGGHAYTREHWYEIHQALHEASQRTRLRIPVLYGIDAIHGANYTVGTTLFPQQLGLAATWNPALVEEAAAITAYEMRASGIPWNFAPVLDLMRQPLWSRVFETYGEDVLLARTLGQAAIRGYQGSDIAGPEQVAACMKHFLGYSFPFTGKDRTPAQMGRRQLMEYFVPTFQAAIDAGASTIMINSGEIDGIPVHSDREILTGLLREQMGFDGVAVSDWEDIIMLHTRHRVAASHKEAIKLAVNAGIDMSMVPLDLAFADLLVELVQEGEVPMSRIDEAVWRILQLKADLGLFDRPFFEYARYDRFGSEAFAGVSYRAALESLTLLQNEGGTLPIPASAKVCVTGPGADAMIPLVGSWSRTWQGTDSRYDVYPGKQTIRQAVEARIGARQVNYAPGCSYTEVIDIPAAVRAARSADYVLLCLAERPAVEKPGDIASLELPAAQRALAEALLATGKPVVLVLVQSRPWLIADLVTRTRGVLLAYQPGPEGGRAVASVLFGDHNPEGRLPFTYPRASGDFITYDHKYTEEIGTDFGPSAYRPLYTFGTGLSYTSFVYSDLQLSEEMVRGQGELTVSVQVTNTGTRAGREVVQLYVRDLYASVTPPVRRLRAFEKITLEPGASQIVVFRLSRDDWSFVGRDLRWRAESGDFEVWAGPLKAEFTYQE